MKILDLKKNPNLVDQYVALRNKYSDLLLTEPISEEETRRWLKQANVEIRILAEESIVLGVVILYLEKEGEIAFFTKEKGKGLGTKLLKIIEDVARKKKLNSICGWVLSDNIPAQRAFIKNGYINKGYCSKEFNNKVYKGIIFGKSL
jgi:GNAT superfamily N-acetyltransferase